MYGQWVDLGVVLQAKLVSVCERWLKELVMIVFFFLFLFNSSWADFSIKLKPPLIFFFFATVSTVTANKLKENK